ncbi:hypothetical protein D3C80_1035940 [compost metagenome]
MGVGARTVPAQQADDEKAGKHADRRMPAENTSLQQKQTACQKRQVHPFHATSTEVTKRGVHREQFVHGQAFVDAQAVQRSGLDPGVRRLDEAEGLLHAAQQVHAVRRRPMGHLLGKRDQRKSNAQHGRVERIRTDSAIQVLAEYHRECGSTDRQPPRAIGGQGQGQ